LDLLHGKSVRLEGFNPWEPMNAEIPSQPRPLFPLWLSVSILTCQTKFCSQRWGSLPRYLALSSLLGWSQVTRLWRLCLQSPIRRQSLQECVSRLQPWH